MAEPVETVAQNQQSAETVALSQHPVAMLPAGGVGKYTPTAMVQLILAWPEATLDQLCQHFAMPTYYISHILASEAFQAALDPVRHLVPNPQLTASLQERFAALAIRSSDVLLQRMDSKEVSDQLVLQSNALSTKALGMGTKIDVTVNSQPKDTESVSAVDKMFAVLEERERKRAAAVVVEDVSAKESGANGS